jgi:hypothetical protein
MKGDCTPRGFEHVGKPVSLTRADAPAGKKGGGSEVSWKLN